MFSKQEQVNIDPTSNYQIRRGIEINILILFDHINQRCSSTSLFLGVTFNLVSIISSVITYEAVFNHLFYFFWGEGYPIFIITL